LNQSQQSIQTLSLWLIHHRKHAKNITQVWARELHKARPNRRLTFLYLANDVVQNSKKKGPEFIKSFQHVLPDAYKHTAKEADEKTKGSMERMLKIWEERKTFDNKVVQKISETLVKSYQEDKKSEKKSEKRAERKSEKKAEKKHASKSQEAAPPKKKRKKELSLIEEVEAELVAETETVLPETEELVRALEELANSASSDAAVREQIAALPPEVSDVSLLQKLKDQKEGRILAGKVEEARVLLADYNTRLAAELEERKRTAKMLRCFILAQKEALTVAEKRLQEYRGKLNQVSGIRKELKSHLQSLPDLTLLPDITGGLAPLPSAGDLFTVG